MLRPFQVFQGIWIWSYSNGQSDENRSSRTDKWQVKADKHAASSRAQITGSNAGLARRRPWMDSASRLFSLSAFGVLTRCDVCETVESISERCLWMDPYPSPHLVTPWIGKGRRPSQPFRTLTLMAARCHFDRGHEAVISCTGFWNDC